MRIQQRDNRIKSEKTRTCRRTETKISEVFSPVKKKSTYFSLCAMIAGMLVLTLTLIQPASANEDPGAEHLTLDEIIVFGDAVDDPTATEVGIKKIEKGKNIDIPDVLKAEPDIDLKRRALIGDTTDSLAIRGFSGNRIMLNINGRPVNAAGVVGGYYIDWGTVPLDNIQKIELIRGGSSVQYGNNALGGVVNVITKKPTNKPTLTFFGTYGGGDDLGSLQSYRLTHTYKIGRIGYSIAGSYQKADPFLWNNDFEGSNMAASIDVDMPMDGLFTFGLQYANAKRGLIRENRMSSDPDNSGFRTKINNDYPLALGETFSPDYGNAFTPGPGAKWDKTKYYFDLGYSQPVYDGELKVTLYKNYEDRKEKNYASSAINASYADGQLVLDRDVKSDRSYGGLIELNKPFRNHELLFGIERKVLAYGDTDTNYIDRTYNNAYWEVPMDLLSYKPSSEGTCWGYYIQDTYRISDRWTLTGGLRWDLYKNRSINGSTLPELDDDAVTPKLTATCHITDADTITASAYQALRTPGLPETYWWAEGETNGDPVLKPEKNNAAEMIYRHDISGTDFLRLSAYYYDVDDYIMFRFDPSWRGVYNIDKARLYGVSLDCRMTFNDWIVGNAGLTWQQSDKQGDMYDTAGLSDELDYLPDWKGAVGVEIPLFLQSLLNVTVRYVGERRAIYAYTKDESSGADDNGCGDNSGGENNSGWGDGDDSGWEDGGDSGWEDEGSWEPEQGFKRVKLDNYFTVDINWKIPLRKHVELSCYAENLFDEDYEEQFGYPMPGMIIGAAVKLSI